MPLLLYLDKSVKSALRVVNVAGDGGLLHPLGEECRVRAQVHLVLEAVGLGALGLMLAVLAPHQTDERHHLLIHEATKADPEVLGDGLDGGGQLVAQLHLLGKGC